MNKSFPFPLISILISVPLQLCSGLEAWQENHWAYNIQATQLLSEGVLRDLLCQNSSSIGNQCEAILYPLKNN